MLKISRRGLGLAFITAMFILVAVASIRAQEVLTNESIIKMVESGLPEAVIAAKIRSSETKFDVTADSLVALKKAGVPDGVLAAMLQPREQEKSAGTAGPAPGAATKRSITHVVADRQIELSPVPAAKHRSSEGYQGGLANPFGSNKIKVDFVLPGAKALYRISERQPVFLVRPFSEGSGTIVRLAVKEDERRITITAIDVHGILGPRRATNAVREEDAVRIDLKMDRGGTYRIVPKQPLEPARALTPSPVSR